MIHGTPIGPPIQHRGHEIQVNRLPIDCVLYVDGKRVGDCWLNPEAAHREGVRHVERIERAAADAAKRSAA